MNAYNKGLGRWVDERVGGLGYIENYENSTKDFAERMYAILNVQSRTENQVDEDGNVKLKMSKYEVEVEWVEGVSFLDFAKIMQIWRNRFVELKNRDDMWEREQVRVNMIDYSVKIIVSSLSTVKLS